MLATLYGYLRIKARYGISVRPLPSASARDLEIVNPHSLDAFWWPLQRI